jgi:hypothetical protein
LATCALQHYDAALKMEARRKELLSKEEAKRLKMPRVHGICDINHA